MGDPTYTGNLVLKTRVAVLTRNLEDVESALNPVQQRRADLGEILELRHQLGDFLGRIERALDSANKSFVAGAFDEVRLALDRIEAALPQLENALAASEDAARRLEERLELPLPAEDGDTPFISKVLHDEMEETLEGLKNLKESVEIGADMRAAWAKYLDELYDNSERLYAEYVEVVGGLAIRDTGFDRGISRIADALIKPFGKSGEHNWDSFAIPARQEASSLTAARIIRLGFPDWTIWTLPLAAHEFGYIFANWNDRIDEYVSGNAELQVCFADAFATYVMGPAYACAAILMRLDPRGAFSKDNEGNDVTGLVAKRVAVILGVLRQMSTTGERGAEDLYGEIRGRLEREWEEALSQVGSSGSLFANEVKEVESWLEHFEPVVHVHQLKIEHWPTIEDWARRLAENDVAGIDLKGIKELRYVLNAAWRARIAVKAGEKDVDETEDVRRLARAAESLWSLMQPEETQTTARRPKEPRQASQPRAEGTEPFTGQEAQALLSSLIAAMQNKEPPQ